MNVNDSYADLTAALVAVQREPKTMDNTPIAGMEDYSQGASNMAMALSQHLTEAIVNGQKTRTELAAVIVTKGLMGQLAWLRAKGYDVPTIAVATFGPGHTVEIEGVLRAEPVHLDTSDGVRAVDPLPEVTLGAAGTEALKPDWLAPPNPWAAYVRGCAEGMSQLHEGPMRSILMDIASELEDITQPEDPRMPELNARLESLLAHQTRHLLDLQSIRAVMGLADGVDIATAVQRLTDANAKLQGLLQRLADAFGVRVGGDIVQGIIDKVAHLKGRVTYLLDEAALGSKFTQELRTALYEHAYDSWRAATAMKQALEHYDLELHAMQRRRYDHAHVAADTSDQIFPDLSELDRANGEVGIDLSKAPADGRVYAQGALRVMVYQGAEWIPYVNPEFQDVILTADAATGLVHDGVGQVTGEHDVGSARDDFVDAGPTEVEIIELANSVHASLHEPDAQESMLAVVKAALERWGPNGQFERVSLPENLGWMVDLLAWNLKTRLAQHATAGKRGWQTLNTEELMALYLHHAVGGDVLDAAAYLGMLNAGGCPTTHLVQPWHGKQHVRAVLDAIEYDHSFNKATRHTDAAVDKVVAMFEAAVLVAQQNAQPEQPSLWRKLVDAVLGKTHS